MPGTLYGVGVGPGDPELLTLKALRVLRRVPVIAVPVTCVDGESYALSVASAVLPPDRKVLRLVFPMVKDVAERIIHRRAAAQALADELNADTDVVFITEGDPLLHSTFIYVLQYLPSGLAVEIVPGVSSVNAAAAEARVPLVNADQRLAVIPVAFEDVPELDRFFTDFDTIVLLKCHHVFDQLLDLLEEHGLTENAVMVERASHPAGRVVREVRSLRGTPIHYLSLLIVQTKRGARVE